MAVSTDKIYEFGEWRLDPTEHLLLRNGSAVPLGPKVFETLLLLVESAGRLVTKDEFMNRCGLIASSRIWRLLRTFPN